jgi:hypothetical protein
VDSSTASDGFSSAAIVLSSSPSQDRSVDFLHNANLVVSQARLPNYMYYSGIDFTHKLDRTTVTVGVLSILVISTSPASVVTEGFGLLSSTGACGSAVPGVCCAI